MKASIRRQILSQRLHVQQISDQRFTACSDILSWMGAIQAQDYEHSRLALATRLPELDHDKVKKAIVDGSIVRTWLMRGTIHFVAKEDLHWLLGIYSTQVIRSMSGRFLRLGLDAALLRKCSGIIEKLPENRDFSREEISGILKKKGVDAKGLELTHILQKASYEGLLVYGNTAGKLSHRRLAMRTGPEPERDESLAKLAGIYFRSRGPATLEDFSWWSGLSLGESKKALELVKAELCEIKTDNTRFYAATELENRNDKELRLLAAFDEYFIAYRNRGLIAKQEHISKVQTLNGIFRPMILNNAEICGTWTKNSNKKDLLLMLNPFDRKLPRSALKAELQKLEKFYGKKIRIN